MSDENIEFRSKKFLEDKLAECGLPTDIDDLIGRKYKFMANDGSVFVSIVHGLHLTITGDLCLIVHEGEILMIGNCVGILKYKDRIDKEGKIYLWS